MPYTHTHTYAILIVSPDAYEEIRQKLDKAGYSDQFHERGGGESQVIDMHGVGIEKATCFNCKGALTEVYHTIPNDKFLCSPCFDKTTSEHPKCVTCGAGLVVCDKCGASWCLDHQTEPLTCPGCKDRISKPLPTTDPVIDQEAFMNP